MNLIALETLTAIITLELLALTAIAYHKANNVQLVTYKPLFKKLVSTNTIFFHEVFGLYCTVSDALFSLDLPVIRNTFTCVVTIPYSPYPLSCDSMRYEVAITNKIPDQGFIDSLFALAKQWLSEMGYAFIGDPIIETNVLKDDYYIDELDCYTLDRIYTI